MPRINKRLLNQKLAGSDWQQFQKILADSFTLADLTQMLRFGLDITLSHIANVNDNMPNIVYSVIEDAEMKSWTTDLLVAAREARPYDDQLLAFAQKFGLAPAIDYLRDPQPLPGESPRQRLERQIKLTNSLINVAQWRTKLGEAEGRVCRIVITGAGYQTFGTGFLLGPDVVMTNYHVMASLIKETLPSDAAEFVFDYKVMSDGTKIDLGTKYALKPGGTAQWLLDYTTYDPLDEMDDAERGNREPPSDHLDYALVRLASAAGNQPIGGERDQPIPNAPPRRWFDVPSGAHTFAPDTPLFILQHPAEQPLKLALDTDSIITANPERTRVRYRTNTEPGSSGSPCFDADWNLVALHHAGDPKFTELYKPQYNQGIPFDTIFKRLKACGKDKLLGAQAGSDDL